MENLQVELVMGFATKGDLSETIAIEVLWQSSLIRLRDEYDTDRVIT
jgi:hypothetical protein